jgi:hypothetical protein
VAGCSWYRWIEEISAVRMVPNRVWQWQYWPSRGGGRVAVLNAFIHAFFFLVLTLKFRQFFCHFSSNFYPFFTHFRSFFILFHPISLIFRPFWLFLPIFTYFTYFCLFFAYFCLYFAYIYLYFCLFFCVPGTPRPCLAFWRTRSTGRPCRTLRSRSTTSRCRRGRRRRSATSSRRGAWGDQCWQWLCVVGTGG